MRVIISQGRSMAWLLRGFAKVPRRRQEARAVASIGAVQLGTQSAIHQHPPINLQPGKEMGPTISNSRAKAPIAARCRVPDDLTGDKTTKELGKPTIGRVGKENHCPTLSPASCALRLPPSLPNQWQQASAHSLSLAYLHYGLVRSYTQQKLPMPSWGRLYATLSYRGKSL